MRSTVRIQDDLLEEIRARAEREKVSLTRALNETLRAGLEAGRRVPARRRRHREKTFALGLPRVDLRKALAVATALEDEETVRKAALRK